MKTRQYTYNEIYRSVNRITNVLNYLNEDDINKTFKDFLTLITVFRHFENVINNLKNSKSKSLDEQTVNIVKSKLSQTPKEIIHHILKQLAYSHTDFLTKIKNDLFSDEIQLNYDDIDLELSDFISNSNNDDYSIDSLSDEKKETSFETLTTDLLRVLSVKDIDEIIDIFMTIHKSSRNKYYLTHSFKSQVLPTFLSQYVQKTQNFVCLGLSPHTILESYKNSFFHTKQRPNFKNEETEIYFEDKEDSEDYYNTTHSLIYNLKSFIPRIFTDIDSINIDEIKDTVVVSIFDSTSELTPIELFEKSLDICTSKAFLLVPYSMISTRVRNLDEDYYEVKNSDLHENSIEQINQHKEFVENQNIERVISFPNNYFMHTIEPQVLLQISKKTVKSIQFVDLSHLDKPIVQGHKRELFKSEQLKLVVKSKAFDEVRNLDKTQLISKYVSYKDIIEKHNYSLLSNNYLIDIDTSDKTEVLDEYFEIKKLQRFNHFEGRVPLKIYSISEFSEFSFTKDFDITKTVRFEAPIPPLKVKEYFELEEENKLTEQQKKQLKDFRKFQKVHQLQDFDILIYVHSTNDITILKNTPIYCVGNHNLLRLRVKDKHLKQKESLSKSLYLFLKSENGQKTLEKIIHKSNTGKDVISIEMLEKIKVDFSNFEEQVKKFDSIDKKQQSIKKLRKEIISLVR